MSDRTKAIEEIWNLLYSSMVRQIIIWRWDKTWICRVNYGVAWEKNIDGQGSSLDEAVQDCLQRVRKEVESWKER